MLSALISGTFGAALTYWVGTRYCGLGWVDCLWAILASNGAGFFALLLTLALERRPAIRRVLLGSALRTWAALAILYVSFMVALDPALRSLSVVAALVLPLIWATGFMLPLWGHAQDGVIRWEHRRFLKARGAANQEFARSDTDGIRVEL